jgi:hypothetical protein
MRQVALVVFAAFATAFPGQLVAQGESPKNKDPDAVTAQASFVCTEVLGFSQSMQWFMPRATHREAGKASQLPVDPFLPGWQGRFTFGASVELWADPEYRGWEGMHRSAAHCERGQVDRVVFNVSGAPRSAEEWARGVATVAEIIRSRYPAVREIVMQPVVGADSGQCPGVRAALNQPFIVAGIRQAAISGSLIKPGPAPKVSTCSQFSDSLGHLTEEGAKYIRGWLRSYYSKK